VVDKLGEPLSTNKILIPVQTVQLGSDAQNDLWDHNKGTWRTMLPILVLMPALLLPQRCVGDAVKSAQAHAFCGKGSNVNALVTDTTARDTTCGAGILLATSTGHKTAQSHIHMGA
jgi:hypothetical protein